MRCRVLFSPTAGSGPTPRTEALGASALEPGGTYRGEVRMYEPDAPPVAPLGLAEYRCRLDVRVVAAADRAARLAIEPDQAVADRLPSLRRAMASAGGLSRTRSYFSRCSPAISRVGRPGRPASA